MDARSRSFMKALFCADSPSGEEQAAIDLIRGYLQPLLTTYEDRLGSLRATIPGPPGGGTVLLTAHADEIGMSVRYIDDDGFIWFSHIGGIDRRTLLGMQVRIHTAGGAVPGVVGVKPTHLVRESEATKVPGPEEIFIDIGAAGKAEAEAVVSIGDTVSFNSPFTELLERRVTTHGLDNAVGCFVLCEILRRLAEEREILPIKVTAVFTTQEEVGLHGATVAAFGAEPSIAICIETEFSTDHPGMDKKLQGDMRMGRGPIIPRGASVHPAVFRHLKETARREGIPYQIEEMQRLDETEAGALQTAREGAATALVMIPLRYMHSPAEVVSIDDIDNTIRLLMAALKTIADLPEFERLIASPAAGGMHQPREAGKAGTSCSCSSFYLED